MNERNFKVPVWTEWKFNLVEQFGLSFAEYSHFICPYPKYHELTVEQIIQNSEELISFVESHPEKPVTKLMLLWIEPRYFAHLQWVFTQLDIDKYEAKLLKERFEDFQECGKLEEKFDALLERHAKAREKSKWITRTEKKSQAF